MILTPQSTNFEDYLKETAVINYSDPLIKKLPLDYLMKINQI